MPSRGTSCPKLSRSAREVRNGVLGGLFFGHETPGIFGEREEQLVLGIAEWAADGDG